MKRILAIIMIAITINMTTFYAYVMPVAATESVASVVPLTSELLRAFFAILGYTSGFGVSVNGLTSDFNTGMFSSMQASWEEGHTVSLGSGYQLVDLRDEKQFIQFLKQVYAMTAAYGVEYYEDSAIDASLMDALNLKSYKATGSLASKSFANTLKEAIDYFEGDGAATLQDDLTSAWKVFTTDGAVSSGSNFGTLSKIFNALVTALICVSALEDGNTWTNAVSSSAWSDYDLYKLYFTYNDVEYVFYNTDNLYATFRGNNQAAVFDKRVYVLPCHYSTNGYSLTALCDESFNTVLGGANFSCYYKDPGYYYLGLSSAGDAFAFEYNYFSEKSSATTVENAFKDYIVSNCLGKSLYVKNATSIYENAIDLSPALDDFYTKEVTAADVVGLADSLEETAAPTVGTETAVQDVVTTVQTAAAALPEASTSTGTGEYSSILDAILAALLAMAAAVWDFFSAPINGILSGVTTLVDIFPVKLDTLGEQILTLPKLVWDAFDLTMSDIRDKVDSIALDVSAPWEGENEQSTDILSLLNGFVLLIMIIIELLKIFVHCLQFIINIFNIEPGTAFLPEDVLLGLNYIKSLEITGLGLSVYDFLMGLVYILIIFFVIKLLRVNIDRMRIPRAKNGGLR
ncbi:MAG: hypothetical protein IJ379_10855 [Lachnospiraceae bacterium]|nr:hypothetical protein [Lachnospiraceae bacterium]